MIIYSIRPLLAIAAGSIAALLILLSGRHRQVRELWTFLAAGAKFALVCSLVPAVLEGRAPYFPLFEIVPGLVCSLRVDPLGLFFALVSSGLWILTSIYSVGYVRSLNEHAQTRYFFAFALSLASTMGIAFAGDLVTFFIFYEMLTLATYPLVAHREDEEAIGAGRKYLVYSLSGGALLLAAIAWITVRREQISFTAGGFLAGFFTPRELLLLFALAVYGTGVKAALFPVHSWLPTAMVAPTPVSALLHAVAVVKAGVFGALRMIGFVFGPSLLRETGLWQPLAWAAALTIIGASLLALVQDNLKRRLAYSTISQLSYILLGAALTSPIALLGAILHISNHAFMKITLFFCAGAIYVKTHKENVSEMDGLGRAMPLTMAAFTLASFGMVGLPLLAGFVSKWFLGLGTLAAERPIFLGVFLFSSLLNAAYFLPISFRAFYYRPRGIGRVRENSFALIVPLLATAILVILFGAVPALIRFQAKLAQLAAGGVFGG